MGLLDYLQTDPNKQEALKMGLLNAGIAMMANQSPNFLGALGQGAANGVSAYQKQFDEAKRKAAMNTALLAAQTPARDATPESYRVAGKPYKTMAEAQAAASPYKTTLPQLGQDNSPLMPNVAQASQPTMPTMLANSGPFSDMAHIHTAVPVNNDATAMLSPQQDVQMPGQQIETVPGQPAQSGGFDFAKMAQHILSSPDAPPELQDMALKYYASQKPQEPPKPVVLGRSLVDPVTGKVITTDSTWADEQKAKREQDMEQLKMRLEDQRLSRQERADLQRELVGQQLALRRDMANMSRAQSEKPYFQFIGTPQGIVTGNARTGQLTLGNLNGTPVMKSADSPQLQGQLTQSKHAGGVMGDAEGTLSSAQASLPQVEKTVQQLKQIGKDATYTYAGQARDAVARQVGIATPGAVAREKYVQTVRDVLFPQLRATFGAQFTVKEGEALVATLGDPNKTPAERNAALDAFIDQKKQHIQSLQRQTGKPVTRFSPAPAAPVAPLPQGWSVQEH